MKMKIFSWACGLTGIIIVVSEILSTRGHRDMYLGIIAVAFLSMASGMEIVRKEIENIKQKNTQ